MKYPSIIWIALVFFASLGFGVACTVDFESDEANTFACENDEDCVGSYRCVDGFCDIATGNNDDPNNGPNNGQPSECLPDELGDDYPLDEPLDIDERCNGQDDNCDGFVDVIFCDSTSDCPSSAPDANGINITQFDCAFDEDFGEDVCQARPREQLGDCFELVLDCVDGQYEAMPEECGGAASSNNDDDPNNDDEPTNNDEPNNDDG